MPSSLQESNSVAVEGKGADGLLNSPSGHFGELLAVTLLDDVGDVVVYPGGRERVADREERIHAVGGLVYLHRCVKHCRGMEQK